MDIVFRWISISRVTYLTYELKCKHFINTNHTRIHVLISMATNVLMSILYISDQTMLSSTWSKHSFSEEHLITWLRIIFSEREVHITRFLGKTPVNNPTQGYCVPVSCESGYCKFEKWKVKWKSGSPISRMKSEMRMPWYRDREWKVKWKCLKIEIESEKWNENASRSRSRSEISREFSRILEKFLRILKTSRKLSNTFHLANFYSRM